MSKTHFREAPVPVAATLILSFIDSPLVRSAVEAVKMHVMVAVGGIADLTVMLKVTLKSPAVAAAVLSISSGADLASGLNAPVWGSK
jgi:hypothetical protein